MTGNLGIIIFNRLLFCFIRVNSTLIFCKIYFEKLLFICLVCKKNVLILT